MKKSYFADILLISSTLIWGTSFYVTKSILNEGTSPLTLMMYRSLFAFIIISPIFFHTLKKNKVNLNCIKNGVLLGIYIYFGFAFQTIGADYTTASKSAFLTTLNVIFVPLILLSVYKQKINRFNLIAIIIAFIGAFIMSFHGKVEPGSNELLGDLLTIISAIFWAIQIIKTGVYSREVNMWILMFIQFITMFLLSLLTVVLFNQAFIISFNSIIGSFYLATVCTVIAFGIMLYAMRYIKPVKASIIFTLEGLFGSMFAILFGLEKISVLTMTGGLLILTALIVSETKLSFLYNRRKGDLR